MSDTWNSFFGRINKQLQKSIEEISLEILEEWRQLVWTEFYMAYTPSSYDRTYEMYTSLDLLKINKTISGIEVMIGYDESQIHTSQNGNWVSHEDISEMPKLIEYGSIYGHDPNGIRAIEDMQKRINSPWFKNKFKELMKQKGYNILFK